jgi:mono/diheme cytochrome c family protein
MDTGILHTHTLIVSLYMLQLVVKATLLTTGKHDMLDKFTAKTRFPHIVLATLMLATGIFLMARSPEGFQPYVFVKLACVFGAIPLGIIAFKRRNNVLAILTVSLMAMGFVLAYGKPAFLRIAPKSDLVVSTEEGQSNPELKDGEQIYSAKCSRCHGANGDSGFQGAKNLGLSTLSDSEIAAMVRNGKGMMPADKDLTDTQIAAVTAYVKRFRK